MAKQSKLYKKEARAGLLFIVPTLIGVAIFALGPLLFSLYAAFTEWNGMDSMNFVGLQNFKDVFSDDRFWTALYNTVFMMIGIPIGIILAILLALAMDRKMFGAKAFRVIYYIPVISSIAAVAILWSWIYNGDYGLLNQILAEFGIKGPSWLAEAPTVKPAIIIMCVWKGLGYTILLYLAGIQSVPKSLYEAAQLDGASGFQMIRKITIPLLRPITFFCLITGVIGGAQIFVEPNIMTSNGGPDFSSGTVVFYLWQKAFINYQMGYASAIAWVLAIFVFVVTIVQFKVSNKYTYEID